MPPEAEDKRRPTTRLLVLGAGALGVLALVLASALAYTAFEPDSRLIPYRWRTWLDESVGNGKVILPQPDQDPAPWVAAKPDRPEDARPADGSAAAGSLVPIEAAAEAADKAITAYRQSRDDPALAMAAQRAIDAIRRIAVNVPGDAATQAAVVEVRDEKATARQHALEDARRISRATHEVAGARNDPESAYLVLRAAAHPQARDLAHLSDGDRVHEFLATGSGWSRVEVLTGPATGQNGYVKDKYLKPLQSAGAVK